MLAQALNSSPKITCFGDVFNAEPDSIQVFVGSDDKFSGRLLSMRSREPVRFLDEHIFRSYPEEVGATGFKFHYDQFWGYPGLLRRLVDDKGLHVLHLRRQNLLRTLVSLKIARETDVFLQDARPRITLSRLLRATRHPSRAVAWVQRRLRPPTAPGKASRRRVTVSADELFDFAVRTTMVADKHDELFGEHPKLPVLYEDMADRRQEVFSEVQSFLGVEPAPLTITLRRQNPEPLRELIENYDELYEAFKDTSAAAFFE